MAKCKNVINGCLSRWEIEELTIIDGYKVRFNGEIQKFMEDCDPDVIDYRNKILERNVAEKDVISDRKLFIFLAE